MSDVTSQRVELKYLVPRSSALKFLKFLKDQNVLAQDKYADKDSGKYTIESLYYDTPLDECFEDSIEGYPLRNKVRIRHYRNSEYKVVSPKHLEIKSKFNQFSKKTRSIMQDEVGDCISTLLLARYGVCGPLLSKIVIEYERYPFLLLGKGDTRVTLDVDIRVKLASDFGKDFRGNVFIHDDFAVLEIKGSNPETVRTFHSFTSKHIITQATRFSKYCLGVLSTDSEQHVDYWSTYHNFLKMRAYQEPMAN